MDAVAVFLANKLPSQQQINQSYFNFTYKPFKREDLTFDILVPTNNWRDTSPTVSPEALDQDTTTLIPLAQQLAPESETGEAKIQVFYTRMGLEIIANDLFGKQFNLTKVKNFSIPANEELTALVDRTMKPFALGVQEQNFGTFYADVSTLLMVQRTPAKLLQAFKGFAEVPELSQISRQAPVLEEGSHIDKDGVLKVGGHYPTQPEATTFELAYIREQNDWKLLGINVAMKKMPQVDEQRSQKTNLLSTENGGQVVFCSNQYNQTSWDADNLIDREIGTNHGYASRNTEPAPTTAAVTLKWGNSWPMQHRSNAGRTT